MSDETQDLPEQTIDAPAAPVVEEPKVHPAWDKMLAELPEVLHNKVAPFLIENDKNVQAQLEKYTPYKEYIENDLSPDYLTGAVNIARQIEQDPLQVYKNLQSFLTENGLLAEEAKQAAQDMMESETGEKFEDLFDEVPAALKKEIENLKAKTTEIEEYKNQQEFERAQAEAEAEIQREMDQLEAQYSGITEAHKAAIFNLMTAALNAGHELSVTQAAKDLQQMIGAFAPASSANASAPTVVGSGGGAGIPAIDVSVPKDSKGKREMLARMFEEYNKANNS